MTTLVKQVLIVGRSRSVLDAAVALLEQRGYRAQATNDFDDVLGQTDLPQLDLVVFGGQVPPAKKDEIRAGIVASNPNVEFVQGLSGIPGLIVDQVEAALAGEVLIPGQAPIYDASGRAIALSLYASVDVTITVYWAEFVPPEPKSHSAVLFEGSLPAGDHRFRVPDTVALDAAFATVRAGDGRWSFRLAAAPASAAVGQNGSSPVGSAADGAGNPGFGTQLIGQTEKALNALLERILAGTGLQERDWVTLRVAAMAGPEADRDQLTARLAGVFKVPAADADQQLGALISRELVAQNGARVGLTDIGRDTHNRVLADTAAIVDRMWGDLPADDLAAAGRVLTTILQRANAEIG
jgi:hypothetical protein